MTGSITRRIQLPPVFRGGRQLRSRSILDLSQNSLSVFTTSTQNYGKTGSGLRAPQALLWQWQRAHNRSVGYGNASAARQPASSQWNYYQTVTLTTVSTTWGYLERVCVSLWACVYLYTLCLWMRLYSFVSSSMHGQSGSIDKWTNKSTTWSEGIPPNKPQLFYPLETSLLHSTYKYSK